ncbi:hypothetical protein CsSME_00029559 [Camellia sinensis var. sinensis]
MGSGLRSRSKSKTTSNDTNNNNNNNNNNIKENKNRMPMWMRKVLLGLGFWVQAMRCFPWMGFNFFLKDNLKVDSSTPQLLQNSANLPMVAKPIYGLLSDSIYIASQHRIS